MWRGMKLKNIIHQRYRNQVVRQFGNAKLIRQPNGQHEIVGGTDADRATAFEWSSLFAHEVVFTHCRLGLQCQTVRGFNTEVLHFSSLLSGI